jgi:TRAP-type mannitol/chloroaromatic compound transport system permease small subunit
MPSNKQEQTQIDLVNDQKVASKDDYEISWVDRINLIICHTTKYLIPGIILVMLYEVFVRYVLFAPTLWANELSLWLAGVVYLIGGIYAMRVRSHIRIVMLYDIVSRRTQRIFDLIGVIVLVLYVIALVKGGMPDASRAFLKWEKFGTAWDPPIPATLKPLILISMILITLQAINNLIIDWKKPKEKAYDPAKDLE